MQSISTIGETAPTQITIRPETTLQDTASANFFSPEGPSFRDMLDIINPLEHIPVVSSLFDDATGHAPSVAARLAGGALFGGPIGFAVALVNEIFTAETGRGVGGTMLAALTGTDTPATQVASAANAPLSTASTAPDSALPPTAAISDALAKTAAATPDTITVNPLPAAGTATRAALANREVLALFGDSAPSAHRAYQNAQLRPYLKQVNKTQIL